METKIGQFTAAKAATVPNSATRVCQLTTDEASLLEIMAQYKMRDHLLRRRNAELLETAFKFNTTPEWVDYMQVQGWVFTNIGTVENMMNLERDKRFISKLKMRMRFRIRNAFQKLKERVGDSFARCAYLRVHDNEGVSLLILSNGTDQPSELYCYGECEADVVYSQQLECRLNHIIANQLFDYDEEIMHDVSYVFREFQLVDDAYCNSELDHDKEDYDEGKISLAQIREHRIDRGLEGSKFPWINIDRSR